MHASRASVMHLAAQKIRRDRVAGLITQRSQVRILSPLLKSGSDQAKRWIRSDPLFFFGNVREQVAARL